MENGELQGTRNAALQLVMAIAVGVVVQMKEAGVYDKTIFLNRVFHYFGKWRRYIPESIKNVDDKLEHAALAVYELIRNPTDTTSSDEQIEALLYKMFPLK